MLRPGHMDTRNVDREGGRLKLLWNATDNLSIKLSAEYLNAKMRADQGLVEYGLRGLEADFAAVITDRLTLDGSLAWIRSKYDEYQNAPCPTFTWPGCVNGAQDLSGRQLDNAPKLTFNIGAEYRHQLGQNNIEWFARADAAYRSSANMEGMLINSRQSSYILYNARLGLDSAAVFSNLKK